jgi:O-antigen/teichoic acid export membrane protein
VTAPPRRSTTSLLLTNGAWNTLSTVVAGATAFLLVPVLLNRMGAAAYGTWILIGSMFAYSTVLHFGFTSAVTRHVAVALAKGADGDLRRIVTTGTMFFSAVALLLATGTLVMRYFLGRWFNIPPELLDQAQTSVLVVGGLLTFTVTIESFGAVLSGYQRFDLITICRASMIILRAIVLVLVLQRGGGLLEVAWIYGLTELGVNLLQYAFATRLLPASVLQVHAIEPALLPEMLAYGTSTFLYSSGAVIGAKVSEALLGVFRPAGDIARFSVAGMGALTLAAAVDSLSAALKPAVSDLDARESASAIHELALMTGKYALLLILPSTTFLVLMGAELIRVWTGLDDPGAAQAMALLSIGQAFRLSQQSNFLILAGKGEHRFFGVSALLVGSGTVVLTLLAVGVFDLGIVGAAIAASVSWIVVAGIAIPRHANARLGITAAERRRRVLGPALAGCAPGMLLLAGWQWLHPPTSWAELALVIVVVAAATAVGAWVFALDARERNLVRRILRWPAR